MRPAAVVLVSILCFIDSALANLCVLDNTGQWVNSVLFDVQDFAFGGVPLNNHTCFEGCLQSTTLVQSYKVSNTLTDGILQTKRKLISSKDLDVDPDYCFDADLANNIQTNIYRATDNTAQAVLKALLYNLALPGGWAYGIAKNSQGWADAPHSPLFCYYNAQLYGDHFQVILVFVGQK